MIYKDYVITPANNRGGKVGRGCNKTSTIQVVHEWQADGTSYRMILAQFRFDVDSMDSRHAALLKAKALIDSGKADKLLERYS